MLVALILSLLINLFALALVGWFLREAMRGIVEIGREGSGERSGERGGAGSGEGEGKGKGEGEEGGVGEGLGKGLGVDWTDMVLPQADRGLVGGLRPGQEIPGLTYEVPTGMPNMAGEFYRE